MKTIKTQGKIFPPNVIMEKDNGVQGHTTNFNFRLDQPKQFLVFGGKSSKSKINFYREI